LFVVALQQAPTTGVVLNDADDGLPLLIDQLLIGERARQQVNGLFKLDTPLLQATPVEGVAVNQVLFENMGGPDSELSGAAGVDAVANGNDGIQIVIFYPARLGFTG